MRQRRIDVLAMLIEHGVGEVVVFVDDKVEGHIEILSLCSDETEFSRCTECILHVLGEPFIEKLFIPIGKVVETYAAVLVEALA